MDFQMYVCKSDLEVKYLLKLNKDRNVFVFLLKQSNQEWKLKTLTRIQQY